MVSIGKAPVLKVNPIVECRKARYGALLQDESGHVQHCQKLCRRLSHWHHIKLVSIPQTCAVSSETSHPRTPVPARLGFQAHIIHRQTNPLPNYSNVCIGQYHTSQAMRLSHVYHTPGCSNRCVRCRVLGSWSVSAPWSKLSGMQLMSGPTLGSKSTGNDVCRQRCCCCC